MICKQDMKGLCQKKELVTASAAGEEQDDPNQGRTAVVIAVISENVSETCSVAASASVVVTAAGQKEKNPNDRTASASAVVIVVGVAASALSCC